MANFSKSFNFRNGVQVDNDKFIVKPSGLVGIGSTLPSEFLDVKGNIKSSGTVNSPNVEVGTGITVGINSTIKLDGGTGGITASNYFGDGSTLTNIVAIATAGFEERSGTLSTTFSVGIGSLNTGSGGAFPDFALDVLGDMRVTGPSTFVGLTTVQGDLFVTQLGVLGISTLKSGLIINEGGATIDQTNVTGVSTFGGAVDINAAVDIDGDTQVDDLNVSGVATFSSLIDGNAGANISGAETIISSATISDLTSGRVVLAGTSGAVEDSSNLTFSGSELKITGNTFVSGISTFSSAIDLNAGIDVDGQADLDEVVVAGVATFSNNIQVGSGGTVGFAKSLSMSDGAHVNLGDQDDLVIRHTGTRSEILERGTGGLKILSDNLEISNASGLGTALKVTLSDQLQIFQDGEQKFNTTGSGVSVYGQLDVASLNGGAGGLSTHTGMLSYGEPLDTYSGRRSLDLVNNDSGNLNFYLNINNIKFNGVDRTGDFNWIKGISNEPSMTLTGIGGSLGVGVTSPTVQFETSGDAKIGQNLTVTDNLTVTTGDLILSGGSFIGAVTGPLDGDVNSTGVATFKSLNSEATTLTGVTTISQLALNTTEMITIKPVGASFQSDTLFNAVAGSSNYYLSNDGFIGFRTQDRFSNIFINGSNINAVFGAFGVGTYSHFESTHGLRGAVDFASAGVSTQRYMVPPKVTTTQRNAFSGLVEGAMIYNTSSNRLEVYTQNSDWVGIATTP